MECYKYTASLIKMIGKVQHKELSQEPFKVYFKKQNTYCVRCKKRTDNKSITPKQLVNKLIAKKSICADCGSKKLVFVNEYKPNKRKYSFHKLPKHAYLL